MSFIPADTEHLGVGRVIEKPLAGGASFSQGALCLIDGSGNWAECGADPALVGGVSVGAAGADTSGFNILARKEFPPNFMQCYWTGNERRFLAKFVGSPPASDGGSFGVVRDADTFWKIDFTEAVNTRLKIVGRRTTAPENQPYFIAVFLAANVQQF